MPPSGEKYTAFGKTLTISQWAKQKECVVNRQALRHRIVNGGWGIVEALTTPTREESQLKIAAFGKKLTAREWEKKRDICKVKADVIRWRIKRGWSPEDAISKPSYYARPLKPGETRRGAPGMQVTAFGETKEVSLWAMDERCVVSRATLYSRLYRGWQPEVALTHPDARRSPRKRNSVALKRGGVFGAFGEQRTVGDWAADPRCVVTVEQLEMRLRDGWSPEDAITVPLFGGRRE